MDHYEMVEKLRQKANVSYEEAKAALEACDWDILDALVLLESEGKVRSEEAGGEFTTQEKKAFEDDAKKDGHIRVDMNGGWSRCWAFIKKLFQKGNANQFVIRRNGSELISMPVTVLVLLLICAWPASLIALFVGLFFGARYSFQGPDIGSSVNQAMEKAQNMVNSNDSQEKKVD